MRRGDSWVMSWQLLGPGDVPVDLTGATARLHLRGQDGALALDASGYLTVSTQGQVSLFVPYQVMDTIPPGRYEFDLEITRPGNLRTTVDAGEVIIDPDVTV